MVKKTNLTIKDFNVIDHPSIDYAQKLARVDIFREKFSDLFYRDTYDNVSKAYPKRITEPIANFSKGSLVKIQKALESEGVVFPEDILKRFNDPKTYKSRNLRKSLFYETRGRLLGEWYKDTNGMYKIPHAGVREDFLLPNSGEVSLPLEGSRDFQLRTVGKLEDIGVAFPKETGASRASGAKDIKRGLIGTKESRAADAFIERSIEQRDFNKFYSSVAKRDLSSKSVRNILYARTDAYKNLLENATEMQSRTIEIDTLMRIREQKGTILNAALADERVLEDAVFKLSKEGAINEGQLTEELAKIRSGIDSAYYKDPFIDVRPGSTRKNPFTSQGELLGKGGVYRVPMTPKEEAAYIETLKAYLSPEEQFQRNTITGKLTKKPLSKAKILENVRNIVSRELAAEDILRGAVKTTDIGLVSSYVNALNQGNIEAGGFGGVAGPATTEKAIEQLHKWLPKHPEYTIRSLKGGVAGYLAFDQFEDRVSRIEETAARAGYKFKKGEVEKLISSPQGKELTQTEREILTRWKSKELREGGRGRFLRNQRLGSPRPTSYKLTQINEALKAQGSEAAISRRAGALALDIETTGFGRGRLPYGVGPSKEYMLQFGFSGEGKAGEFYTNMFSEGKIPGGTRGALMGRYKGPFDKKLGGIGAYHTTGIPLGKVVKEGLPSAEVASRIQEVIGGKTLLTYGGRTFDMARIKEALPMKYMGLQSLDVQDMSRAILKRKDLRLFREQGFNKLYQQGNIALNLGIDVGKLHTAKADALLTQQIYEKLAPYAEREVSMGRGIVRGVKFGKEFRDVDLSEFSLSKQAIIQQNAIKSGEILARDIGNLGIQAGAYGSSEFAYSIPSYRLEQFKGGEKLVERLQAEASADVAAGRTASKIGGVRLEKGRYLFRRGIIDPELSIERAFAAEYGERLTQIRGVTSASNRNIQRGMPEWMSAAKKNWKGLAMAGAAVGIGLYLLHSWKSKPSDPIGNEPGEQASSSLFGGTGMNTMQPPTMESEGVYNQAERSMPMSYATRIMDPNSVATNIRVRGGIENRIDYNALGRAMGIMGSNMTGAESSNVSMRVSDNTTKMSDGDIRRKIARMA